MEGLVSPPAEEARHTVMQKPKALGMWTLPPDSPVPSQDTMLNCLLLLFIHVRDAIFEELKTGTERDDQ